MKYNYLKLAILTMFMILLPGRFSLAGFTVVSLYWIVNVEKKYWILVLLVLAPLIFSQIKPIDKGLTGRVTDIKNSSFIVNNTVVYTKNIDVNYDDIVTVETEKVNEFDKNKSRYSFDFSNYYKTKDVFYYCFSDEVTIEKQAASLRSRLYEYINNIRDPEIRSFCKLMIFNIPDDDSNFIIVHGLYFSGIFWCLNYFLKWFLDKDTIGYLDILNCLILCLFYHFPLVLTRLLVKKILLLFKLNSKDRLGLLILILLTINKNYIYSLGFIYPVSFYFVTVFHKDEKVLFYLDSMVVQSLFFYKFNLIQVFVYKYLMRICGFIYIITVLLLPINQYCAPLYKLLCLTDILLDNDLNIYGRPELIILIIMSLIYRVIEKNKYRYHYLTLAFILLMFSNVSHIYGSVSFIDVGQGDSILIRLPYNRGNILVDTGKESAYNSLDSYLSAKGCRKLDYLIITHDDSDHNGNLNNLLDDYEVDHVIADKNPDITIDGLKLIGLNRHEYDNDNDNSLVYYFRINGLSFLLTGDISKKVERRIIRDYPALSADVLKLSHHGSKSGSDEMFLKQIKPEIAVVSSGDTYHHPHAEVIENLENNHIVYFMTKNNGDIEFVFTKFFNIIKLWHKDFVIIDNRW